MGLEVFWSKIAVSYEKINTEKLKKYTQEIKSMTDTLLPFLSHYYEVGFRVNIWIFPALTDFMSYFFFNDKL